MRLFLSVFSSLILLPSSLLFAQVAQIGWDVQQDRPVPTEVHIWRGETVDLMPRLVQGTRPVAVTNAPVEFRYREAALTNNTYRYVTATANTNSGVLAVHWIPDYDAGAAWYDYQIIVGSNAANPRAFGRITMRGTIGHPAPGAPPPPISLYPTRTDLESASNALAAAVQTHVQRADNPHGVTPEQIGAVSASGTNGWEMGPHQAWLTSEADAAALAALATNEVRRLQASATNWMEYSGSNVVWLKRVARVNQTNVTFAADFENSETHATLFPDTYVWPDFPAGWQCGVMDFMGNDVVYVNNGNAWWFGALGGTYVSAYSATPAVGIAWLTVVDEIVTNATPLYLQTNSVPPESWSYVSMTNWLAVGGAGETWALGIAEDTAQTLMNGHTGASDPHTQYAVRAGAVTNHYAGPLYVAASNYFGLIVTGTGKVGGTDNSGGAAIAIFYNAVGNKQLWFGSSEGGPGVRFVGASMDSVDITTGGSEQMIIGGYIYPLIVPVSVSTPCLQLYDYGTSAFRNVFLSNGVFVVQ